MTARAVMFDLDGTLLDTLEDIGRAANRVLASNGFPEHPLESFKYFVGDGAAVLFQRALPEGHDRGETFERCLREFREDYGRAWNVTTTPYPGIPELLDGLVRRGMRMSVLSNKPHAITEACVGGLLARWTFDAVSGFQEGVPKKPDPSGAIAIARRMGLAPDEFLFLGDTGTDMETARGAGMRPIGALWGFRTREELLAHGAERLLQRPEELLDLL
jgi:phosphoglycolate phosphatase